MIERYSRPEMAAIWSTQHRLNTWLNVELALVETLEENGEAPEGQVAVPANMWPVALHLLLVLWLGISIPGFLALWFNQATILISGSSML